ncbi:bifunctional uridylyltransferase/uridylyl-removing protein GlnD [uncultured Shewanella sp.]|uniref:bifunctional uridylyltransferase/uridylyl-removing protein GlnD n=1 Tax=uncultured Shewanella sp. TaxID=173975 RepID=UPI002628A396|nr:bifunctional uridylyltransferase/uridylyl-removing protein GlnD [uncultured Shewanella sp.]
MKSALCAKNAFLAQNETSKSVFSYESDVYALVTQRCQLVDDTLKSEWLAIGLDTLPVALIAVGGYGRGELHPQSDVDLLFLVDNQLNEKGEQKVGEFITFLWDAGLEIGHSVRTITETLEQGKNDVTIATNLLEARLLCGPQALFAELYTRIRSDDFWPSSKFYLAKREEQALRHAKANAFDLEPNIKSCPGGLRDIQTITWVAMRYFNAAKLEELVSYNFLEPIELEELLQCQGFLWQLRFALHLIAGRDENRLLFDLQPRVAELMGYVDGTQLAVELMMKQYYQTIRRVLELNQMLLQLFKQATLSHTNILKVTPINEDFQRRGKLIESLSTQGFNQPEKMMTLFLHVAQDINIKGIFAPTLRSLRQARDALTTPLMAIPECRKVFMEILRHPQGISALSLMHKHGIMSAYLPAWRKIEGQMQFDLFHAYTVDEHTHRLLLNIERFSQADQKMEFPLGSVIINQLPKKGLLVLAAIFHDIAKGRGGDHSQLGSQDAMDFCQLHGMNSHDGRMVSWLVENHLLMSITAQRRDISDPDVIAVFADKVRTATHLSYLYCLTVADMCATNDKLWNNWKGALLRDLYFLTQRVLARGKEKPVDIRARVREHQAKVKKELLRKGFQEEAIDKLWQRFTADYFIKHQPNQLSWHAEAILKHKKDEPLVMLSKHSTRGGTELFIYSSDKAKLFVSIMAILDNKNVCVNDATILITKDKFVVDTFVVIEQDGSPITHLPRIQSIKKALIKALNNQSPKLPKFRKLPRKMKHFKVATQVSFPPSPRNDTSMMELITLDCPGLLAKLGDVLYRCKINVRAAKISTIGERAEDFFLLQTIEGGKLSDEQKAEVKSSLVRMLTAE